MSGEMGLDHLVARAAQDHGERAAILDGDRVFTFDDIEQRVAGLAGHLAAWGVRRGERVAVQMANRVEFPISVLALVRAGAVAVLVSPAWKSFEVDHALGLTGACRALVDDAEHGVVAQRLGSAAVLDVTGLDVTGLDLRTAAERSPVDGSADAVLVFSSGTTGLPKAVRHTHASLTAATRDWAAALGLSEHDRFQISTPPSHILGLLNLMAALQAGATVRLHRRFDLEVELASIETDRMTLEMAVAPIMLAIAALPDLERRDLSSLRYIMWGATPVTESVARTVTARTGVPVLAAYGASEMPVLAVNPVSSPSQWRLDSPGLPPADVELRTVDLLTGQAQPVGSTGELEARGPSMMAGYLPEEADAGAFDDGWYRTGDVGTVEPGGWVRITDRSKDMIKVSGFQVAPAELESVLLGHPAVVDCAVFGVPDERTGEAPVAAVQLDPSVDVAGPVDVAEKLAGYVAGSLAGYKRLREVIVVDTIPRLPSGKALRRELRADFENSNATLEEQDT